MRSTAFVRHLTDVARPIPLQPLRSVAFQATNEATIASDSYHGFVGLTSPSPWETNPVIWTGRDLDYGGS